MLNVQKFKSNKAGPHVLFLGAVHGDEICGPEGIQKVIADLESNNIHLKQGEITFVPVANPLAYEQNVRQVNVNLNRIIEEHSEATIPEHHFANEIVSLIKQADVLIDLHSFEREGEPFLFLDHPSKTMQALADTLGGKAILYGWDNIYKGTTKPSHCTEWCAFQNGTESLTFECGTNGSQESIEKAYQAIIRTLAFFEMIDVEPHNAEKTHHLNMQKLYVKKEEGNFVQNFKNITHLKEGSEIAKYDTGKIITMPFDGFLILPKPWAQVGGEWFYTATEIE